MKLPSPTEAGDFSDREMIQTTGIRAKIRISLNPIDQRTYSRAPRCSISPSPSSPSRARPPLLQADAEYPNEDERDRQHADEDQHRDRRAQPQIEAVDQLVVAQDRDRLGVLGPSGH